MLIIALIVLVPVLATGAFLLNMHINNLCTIELNRKAAEREAMAAASRIN